MSLQDYQDIRNNAFWRLIAFVQNAEFALEQGLPEGELLVWRHPTNELIAFYCNEENGDPFMLDKDRQRSYVTELPDSIMIELADFLNPEQP